MCFEFRENVEKIFIPRKTRTNSFHFPPFTSHHYLFPNSNYFLRDFLLHTRREVSDMIKQWRHSSCSRKDERRETFFFFWLKKSHVFLLTLLSCSFIHYSTWSQSVSTNKINLLSFETWTQDEDVDESEWVSGYIISYYLSMKVENLCHPFWVIRA